MERTRLLLLAHGSPDPRWRAPFEKLLQDLQEELGADCVRLGFMEFAQPTFLELAAEAEGEGIGCLRILPLFMAGGGHVDRDIPAQAAKAARHYPRLRIEILPPVGEHPRVVEALVTVARTAAGRC